MKLFYKLNGAQISVVEIPLLILLFISSIIYLNHIDYFQANDYSLNVQSNLDSIYYSNEFRKEIILENLSNSSLTENWSNLSLLLNKSYLKYEFIISNGLISKKIFYCNSSYNKYYSERIISIYNNTEYEFRIIKLGVCY